MKIIVIGLNISPHHPGFKPWCRLSFTDKLSLISMRIKNLYEIANNLNPTGLILIAWREYGLTGNNIPITSKMKKIFKEKIQELTNAHPNLIILAGTILSKKNFSEKETIPRLQSIYKETAWADNMEQDKKFRQKAVEKINKKTHPISAEHIDVVRNSAYIFNADLPLKKHDKIFPFSSDLQFSSYSLFQPAKGANLSSIICISNSNVFIGIDICRDHYFGVLQREIAEKKLKKPLIHFVLSDSINLCREKFAAPYIIHLDSQDKIKLIVTNLRSPKQNNHEVLLFKNNLLNDKTFIRRVHPFFHCSIDHFPRKNLVESVEKMKNKLPSDSTDYQYYLALRAALYRKNIPAIQRIVTYQNIEDILVYTNMDNMSALTILERKKNVDIIKLILPVIRNRFLIDHGLLLASRFRLLDLVQQFINMNADPNHSFATFFWDRYIQYPLVKPPLSIDDKKVLEILFKSKKMYKQNMESIVFNMLRHNDISGLQWMQEFAGIELMPVVKNNLSGCSFFQTNKCQANKLVEGVALEKKCVP